MKREGVEIAKRIVSRLSKVYADEASHWDELHEGWTVGRINHSEAIEDSPEQPAGCERRQSQIKDQCPERQRERPLKPLRKLRRFESDLVRQSTCYASGEAAALSTR